MYFRVEGYFFFSQLLVLFLFPSIQTTPHAYIYATTVKRPDNICQNALLEKKKKEEKKEECTGELMEGLGVGDSIDQRRVSTKACHYHHLVKGAHILETKQKAKLDKLGTQEV